MQDSEKQYPSRRATRNQSYRNTANDDSGEGWDAAEQTMLPQNGLTNALGIGVAGGILAAVLPVVITLISAPVYQEASRLGDKMSYGTAQTLLWLGVTYYLLELFISFFAGYFVGKLVVRRLYGFYAGMLVGAISFMTATLTQYIPGYPNRLVNTAAGAGAAVAGALFYLVVILLIRTAIAGLMGLWGARASTKSHAYYRKVYVEEE